MRGQGPQMTLMELYQSQGETGDRGDNARALLKQTHWFTVNSDFDPKTGEALPQALSAFLAKVTSPACSGSHHDRLWRITEHARPSVERLFHTLNESPRREHAILPIHAVRELDANSFIKLSNRPGRTIREKLAGNPYLQAVRRFQSVDLHENRLLKAFVIRLAELLEMRQDFLGEVEDELLPKIQSWLLCDEACAIARWENLPPNNTLLSHRDYRRIWDAWRWLQTIDDDIDRDYLQLEKRSETMRLWNKYARMYVEGRHRFAEMPVLFDYEGFKIRPWSSPLAIQRATPPITRSVEKKEGVDDPICIDLAVLYPRYASKKVSAASMNEAFLWQQWQSDSECIDIGLFNSDAAYLHSEATTIASSELFFSKDNAPDQLDRAARAFAAQLSATFKNDGLIWLIPDFVNDFELEITRRNLNACFAKAEPLPRSVAAVFEQVDYSKIRRDGFPIVVVDTIGDKTCVTKLFARRDPELQQLVPETRGFYWERCPTVIISSNDSVSVEEKDYDFPTVDEKGQWRDAMRPAKPQFIQPSYLKSDSRIGQFSFCINLTESPVVGGILLHALQRRSGDIPLWRDQIPELSIKLMKDGRYQRFHLVSHRTTIIPIRDMSIPIPVEEDFTLPAGKAFYQFPLFQGENADELGFSARLDSPAFPLKKDTVCKLDLTFEYGADEPYQLVFIPLNNTFPPVRATWRRSGEVIITDAPAPDYPRPMTWDELRRVPRPDGSETSDLLDWIVNGITQLDSELFRTIGKITSNWRKDQYGAYYTFVQCNIVESVFIHENNFVEGLSYNDFGISDEVSFALQERGGRHSGRRVGEVNYEEPPDTLIRSIRKRLYYPMIQVWRDGRSIQDAACPSQFAAPMRANIKYLASLLKLESIPNPVQREVVFLLACMHKDMPVEGIQWFTEQIRSGQIRDPEAVGLAIGDVSRQWQEYALSELMTNPTNDSLRILAYAIWREQHFVERFSLAEVKSTLTVLSTMLGQIEPCPPRDKVKWVRATAEPLELLLGLLRTRSSADTEIRMLLQPHQKITKELAKQVERVTEVVAQSNVPLLSRVHINLQKPHSDRTPDLLYALRLYLTGDDGANAIHITSVSDGEND